MLERAAPHLGARRRRPGLVVRRLGARPDQVTRPRPSTTRSTAGAALYRTALSESNEQHKLAISTTATKMRPRARPNAAAPMPATSSPCCATTTASAGATDFYSYRYLASEGFLPGYSFPRLPLAAYIPARRGGKVDGDYLQRPRFVAISEFGPNA